MINTERDYMREMFSEEKYSMSCWNREDLELGFKLLQKKVVSHKSKFHN